jgi:hypothetical protein
MRLRVTEAQYQAWLRAAYKYYIDPDEFGESGMSDYDWDMLSRRLYAERDDHPDWVAIQHPDFEGMSLYFLRATDYPEWAKRS